MVFALPDMHVYTHALQLQNVKERHIDEYLPGALAKVLPLPQDAIVSSWMRTGKTKDSVTVVAVAADRSILQEWQDFFAKAQIRIEAFDIEGLALCRDLVGTAPKEGVCIIDI